MEGALITKLGAVLWGEIILVVANKGIPATSGAM